MLPSLPFRIVANRVHHHLAPNAVAARNLHRLASQGHQRIHEITISFSPHKRMHAAHGGAADEAQSLDAEALAEKLAARPDHVVVIALRTIRVQTVAVLRGFPMPAA